MRSEQTPAALLLNLPQASLAGIDLLSFTVSPRFRGVKHIPAGLHFLFTGASNAFSVRHGLWFLIGKKAFSDTGPNGEEYATAGVSGDGQTQLFISKWVQATESLVTECDAAEQLRWRANIGEFWREGLMPYRQSAGDGASSADNEWSILTSSVTPRLLSRITANASKEWSLTSASSASRDRDDIPGLSQEDITSEELNFLRIDLKQTWRDGVTGRERTDAAMDRSWALGSILETHKVQDVIGELQFCFLMTLTLNNWSCFEQWKRILQLVLTCRRAVQHTPDLFIGIIAALRQQLSHIQDAEGGLIDMADEGGSLLKSLLVRFRRGLLEMQSLDSQDVIDGLDDLEAFLRDEYGWQFGGLFVRTGILELEDGEQVRMDTTDFDEDDETGEYAPQVVELSSEQARMLSLDDPALVSKLESSAIHEDSHESDEEELSGDLEDLDERY